MILRFNVLDIFTIELSEANRFPTLARQGAVVGRNLRTVATPKGGKGGGERSQGGLQENVPRIGFIAQSECAFLTDDFQLETDGEQEGHRRQNSGEK